MTTTDATQDDAYYVPADEVTSLEPASRECTCPDRCAVYEHHYRFPGESATAYSSRVLGDSRDV